MLEERLNAVLLFVVLLFVVLLFVVWGSLDEANYPSFVNPFPPLFLARSKACTFLPNLL